MKILYIISQRRSGSTLIENLLGQHDEVISVGEFRMLKNHYFKKGPGYLWDWKCNCGADIEKCGFWSKYYKPDDTQNKIAETALKYKFGLLQWIRIYFTGVKSIIMKNKEAGQKIASYTLGLYRNIEKDHPGNAIIDSSKDALQGYFLAEESGDVIVLYLVRQLRATVSSKYKRAINIGKPINLFKLLISSFFVEIFNQKVVKKVSPKKLLCINYEDFVANTDYFYSRILKELHLTENPVPEFFKPYPSHSIAGTPDRFKKRAVTYDDRWKQFYKKRPVANIVGSFLEKRLG